MAVNEKGKIMYAPSSLVCNTSDTHITENRAEIFSYPLQITRSIQVE